jgi:ABC-type lipoprotein release transport system permease subunit
MAFGEEASTARIALWGFDPQQEANLMEALRRRSGDGPAVLEPGSVFLGASLAERLEVGPSDPVTLSVLDPEGGFDAIDYQVAGVLERGAPWQDYFVYLVLADLQELMGTGDAVSMLKLRLPGGLDQADTAVARLRPALQSRPVEVGTYREKGRLYMGIISASRIQAWMIDIVLLVAVAFGVAGAQILAVHERQREFGTMAALGTSRSLIRGMILSEGVLLSLLAGAAGALLGMAVSLALGRSGLGMDAEAFAWMVGGPRVLPQVDAVGIAWTLLELVVVVTLSGLYPAARAARLLPVDALRGGAA